MNPGLLVRFLPRPIRWRPTICLSVSVPASPVSLLRFGGPKVYIPDNLPTMGELRKDEIVRTREVDQFEAAALERSHDGEEVVVDNGPRDRDVPWAPFSRQQARYQLRGYFSACKYLMRSGGVCPMQSNGTKLVCQLTAGGSWRSAIPLGGCMTSTVKMPGPCMPNPGMQLVIDVAVLRQPTVFRNFLLALPGKNARQMDH